MRRILPLALLFCITTISVVAWAQTPLNFIPIGPCRVVDTRSSTSPAQPAGFGPPSLAAGSTRTFIIPDNPNCSVPNTSLAYSLNVTVVPNGNYLGYLTIWPDSGTQPTVSSLNSYDGSTKADAVIVPAGTTDAGVSVYVPDETDLVIDVAGYWVGPSNPATGQLQFYNIPGFNLCRLVNTTNPTGPLGGPALSGGTGRSFPVQSGFCGIPTTAVAYSLNVTAVPISGAPVSYVTVWPSTQAQPGTSTLNAPTGTTVENATIIPTGGGSGAISAFSPDDTNLLIDINGYFAPPSTTGFALYTVTPCRVLDTRSTSGPFNGQMDVQIQPVIPPGGGPCNLPTFSTVAPEAYVLNVTALPFNGAGLGYLTVWPQSLPQPLPPTLVALNGLPTSNMAVTFSGNGYISTFASSPTNMLVDINGYFASDMLVITTTSLPTANQFTPYPAFQATAQGGVPPYNWSTTPGPFPAGITITAGGSISATCVTGVTSTPTLTVVDSATPPDTASMAFTLTVNPYVAMSFVTTTLPPATIGSPYPMTQVVVQNGVAPYTFSTPGGLPAGLTLSSSGVISGTPIMQPSGTYTFTITVVDNSCDNPAPGNTIMGTFSITLT